MLLLTLCDNNSNFERTFTLVYVNVSLTCSRRMFLDVSYCHLVPKLSVIPPQPSSGESDEGCGGTTENLGTRLQ